MDPEFSPETVAAYRQITKIEVTTFNSFPNFYHLTLCCPLLRRLEIKFNGNRPIPTLSTLGSAQPRRLPDLEELIITNLHIPNLELLADVIRDRDKLLLLDIEGNCLEPSVVSAEPRSVEHLQLRFMMDSKIYPTDSDKDGLYWPISNKSLRIIGELPNLTVLLGLAYDDKTKWPSLLHAASRLTTLGVVYPEVDNAKFTGFFSRMDALKTLYLDEASGNCDYFLCALSSLRNLENLRLCSGEAGDLYMETERGILALSQGPLRNSLLSISIVLDMFDDEQVLERCFHERDLPKLTKQPFYEFICSG
eukprot:CAMPEP_0174895686 /NCGR_PEP_ID=MMETSP0167-20121228/10034_1 /TAXON_ID=38298 /ORGANISM="Rhodella maculata, Strain CCMP736" /LENGTH=306 /DNA_ID=CAMNT_0016135077 /DNA_START=511 /DNA_END=1431 /DNA_ORIENTATION=+